MGSPLLFRPIRLRDLTLPNRIVISPMCQYGATDGCASDWHLIHLGHLGFSGAGLLIIEATGVEARGRISPACLGLYSDESEAALGEVLNRVRTYANMPIGIQLSHAGRKASISLPGSGVRGPVDIREGGWETLGPSARGFAETWRPPREMTETDMRDVVQSFVQATQRCVRLGLDLIEIHSAHGYLLSSFLSPVANNRTDSFGGSLANRMRFPLSVVAEVRANWPESKPLGVRLNGTDWLDNGITPTEAAAYSRELEIIGCDYVVVSSGGNGPAEIPLQAGYQVRFAEEVKKAVKIPVMTVGLIREPALAETILAEGSADLVAIGRAMLYDARWPWRAAEELGAEPSFPWRYGRGALSQAIPNYDTLPARGSGGR